MKVKNNTSAIKAMKTAERDPLRDLTFKLEVAECSVL